MERLRDALAASARELETLAVRDPPPGSGTLLHAGDSAAAAARRLASAAHCLHEWREPEDDVADTRGPAGLRNVRLWADSL